MDEIAVFSQITSRRERKKLPPVGLDLALSVLDTPLSVLFDEVFTRTRYFDLGLAFYDICQGELAPNKDTIDDWQYARYQRYLIALRLKMLDYQNDWDGYVAFTHEALASMRYPYILNVTRPVEPIYIYTDEAGADQIHFLYQYGPRYKIICRKIERRNAGKSVDHLLRHQQNELTDDEIRQRYNVVVDFFTACYNR